MKIFKKQLKNTRNYIEDISHITYAAAYNSVKISKRVIEYVKRLAEKVNC